MAVVYGYGRHSTEKQGLTELNQRETVERYISMNRPLDTYGGWFYDAAHSGSKDIFERPRGREVWALVQPDDHIVWAKLDRAFRNQIDGLRTIEMLRQKGVNVHSLDFNLDTSTSNGRCMLSIMLALGQQGREQISENTSASLQAKKRAGLPYNSGVPIGWKKVGVGRKSRFDIDNAEREQALEIVGMRTAGMSYDTIVSLMRRRLRPNGRQWNRNTARRAYHAAIQRFPKVVIAVPPRSAACS